MNLVVGATGMLGGRIVRKLLAKGAPVRAMVRKPSDRQTLEATGANAVFGDLKSPASLAAACKGVSTVITTANAAQRGGADTVESVDLMGNRALIDAAKNAGVRHFVFMSAHGVDESSPVPLFVAKAKSESHLRDSGVDWTIIAPTGFMDVWFPMIIGTAVQTGQPVPLVAGGKRKHSFIAVDDVADFAVASVDYPAAARKRLDIGGPDAVSWSDIVSTTSRLLGRKLPIQSIEPGQPIPTLPPPINQFIGFLMAGLEQHDTVLDTRETARTFGVSLTPAETVLRQLFAAGR